MSVPLFSQICFFRHSTKWIQFIFHILSEDLSNKYQITYIVTHASKTLGVWSNNKTNKEMSLTSWASNVFSRTISETRTKEKCTYSDILVACDLHTLLRDRRHSSVQYEPAVFIKHTDSVLSWTGHVFLPPRYWSASLWPPAGKTTRFTIMENLPPAITNQLILEGRGQMPRPWRSTVGPCVEWPFCVEFNLLHLVKGLSTKCHRRRNQMWRQACSESS